MSKIKHISLFKFKDGTPPEQVDQVFDEVLDATENVAGLEDYVAGENCSPEGMTQGYTHGYIMTFQDSESRDGFLSNPEHQRISALLEPHVESRVILDFEV